MKLGRSVQDLPPGRIGVLAGQKHHRFLVLSPVQRHAIIEVIAEIRWAAVVGDFIFGIRHADDSEFGSLTFPPIVLGGFYIHSLFLTVLTVG